MRGRVRLVVLFGTLAVSILALQPHLGTGPAPAPAVVGSSLATPAVGSQPGGVCPSTSARCSPTSPAIPSGSLVWEGAVFVLGVVGFAIVGGRLRRSAPPVQLLSGVRAMIHRPPRALSPALI